MLALTFANLKMLGRNRQTTFWALFFPLILVVVFGLFDFSALGRARIAVIDGAQTPASEEVVAGLRDIAALRWAEPPESPMAGRELIAAGDLDYLLVIPEGFAVGGPAAPISLTLTDANRERNQLILGLLRQRAGAAVAEESVMEPPPLVVERRLDLHRPSYFDLVLLGLVGMGVMTNAIISVAVRLSNYRNLSILRRLLATPLPIWKFFAAEIAAQLVLALAQAGIILAVGVFIFGAQLPGNWLYLLPVVLLGSLIFLNIGFILSAWANTPAAASGMGNAIAFPMMLFAGVFFPTSALPWLLPYAADALPLAPMLTALRDIALQEAALWEVWPQLAILAGWAAATALVAVRVFRFS